MAYKLRDQRPGYHHIVTRGNNKQTIYLDDRDRASFLVLLDWVARKYDWDILTYCLMRNHYHLVVKIRQLGLARGMCELNGIYALYFNGQHARINHLFGRRYWSEFARTEEHLKNVIRYVVQNPRRAGKPGPLESHPWTSYAATIGEAFTISRFARTELLELFGRTPAQAILEFSTFCNEPAPLRHELAGPVRRQPPVLRRVVRVT
jgi:REP element-mobilizing transposase RayT